MEILQQHIETTYSNHTLSQSDFDNGTLVISEPGVYTLSEDIVFHPDPINPSPVWGDKNVLGWFSAISINTNYVCINLNGYCIKQSKEHHLHQRFFSLIELADRPFETSQGPANFGTLQSVSNIVVYNGALGLSSHFGIHGNSPTNVYIHNISIFDFEIAGIQLGGGENIVIYSVNIDGSLSSLGVTAKLSHANFILPRIKSIVDRDGTASFRGVTGSTIYNDLLTERDSVIANILAGNTADDGNANLLKYSKSSLGADGNSYGIAIHSKGVLVNGIKKSISEISKLTKNITIMNTNINNIVSTPIEMVGLCEGSMNNNNPYLCDSGAQHDSVGGVLDKNSLFTNSDLFNDTDTLIKGQIFVAKNASTPFEIGASGSVKINDDIITFADDTNNPTYESDCKCVFNGDSMHHAMKGNVGIFLSGVEEARISCCSINNISNHSEMSTGEYNSLTETSHSKQTMTGYQGSVSRGVLLSACKDIRISNLKIDQIKSSNGCSLGIDVVGSKNVSFKTIETKNIKSITSNQSSEGSNQDKISYSICNHSLTIGNDEYVNENIQKKIECPALSTRLMSRSV